MHKHSLALEKRIQQSSSLFWVYWLYCLFDLCKISYDSLFRQFLSCLINFFSETTFQLIHSRVKTIEIFISFRVKDRAIVVSWLGSVISYVVFRVARSGQWHTICIVFNHSPYWGRIKNLFRTKFPSFVCLCIFFFEREKKKPCITKCFSTVYVG